jgi:histone H1/5
MKNTYKRFMAWLLMAQADAYNPTATDKDNDGLVQEGTPFERKVAPVKKAAAKKKAPAKKAVAKKAPAKKAPVKKTAKKTAPKKK